MMGDNSYLKALMLLKRTKPLLMCERRDQIQRAGLLTIQQMLLRALEQLNRVKDRKSDLLINGNMLGILEIVEMLLENPEYTSTDTETKELLSGKLTDCINTMYVDVGKYYMNHDFDMEADQLDYVLQEVIDKCIQLGYYFDEDKRIEEDKA